MLFFGKATELATLFQIQPTRANLRRISKAIEIVDAKQVTFIGQQGHLREYEVHPQGGNPKMRGTGRKYTVHSSGANFPVCDCPDWSLLATVREQREKLKDTQEAESTLKTQVSKLRAEITTLKQKAKPNPALVAANQQFSALAKVSDQEQRRTKLMEVCSSLVGDALDSVLDLITPNREQLTGDEAMRL